MKECGARPRRTGHGSTRPAPARHRGQPRRRPAAAPARRPPAAAPAASSWDRVGRIALTLVLAAVLYSYLNPAIDFVKTYTATTAAKAKLHELLDENKQPPQPGPVCRRPDRDRRARPARQGMVAEGETPDRRPRPRRLSRARGRGRWLASAPTSSGVALAGPGRRLPRLQRLPPARGGCSRPGRAPRPAWSRRSSASPC